MGILLNQAYEEKDFIDSILDGDLQKLDGLSKKRMKKVIFELLKVIHFYRLSFGLY